LAKNCSPTAYYNQINPVLQMLLEDDDRDVRAYADASFSILEEEFSSMLTA
jgi:hypothetical protein